MTPPLYALAKLTVGTALRLAWRPTVHGLAHVPTSGGAILAGNHLSVADELFLGAVVRRHIAFWANPLTRITGPADVRRLTDEVMAAIQDLTGREYVAAYAPRREEATP